MVADFAPRAAEPSCPVARCGCGCLFPTPTTITRPILVRPTATYVDNGQLLIDNNLDNSYNHCRFMAKRAPKDFDQWLIEQIAASAKDIASLAVREFGLTRQAVSRHLRRLVAAGVLEASGQTRGRIYKLARLDRHGFHRSLTRQLQEDEVWRAELGPRLEQIPDTVRGICQYGFTEIFNNAIEHSESDGILVMFVRDAVNLQIVVQDQGVGIFAKLRRDLSLDDERHAVLELSKGKVTTDPERHTGEGIFLTSRMFDVFNISSGALNLCHQASGRDWLLESLPLETPGTLVGMTIAVCSTRTLQEVFDAFAGEHSDWGFARTNLLVDLARHEGEKLLSRSQAKRLLARVERFKEVVLDFDGVEMIGQAFADETFRVFQHAYPETRLTFKNTTPEVDRMIRHVLMDGAPS